MFITLILCDEIWKEVITQIYEIPALNNHIPAQQKVCRKYAPFKNYKSSSLLSYSVFRIDVLKPCSLVREIAANTFQLFEFTSSSRGSIKYISHLHKCLSTGSNIIT